MRVNACEVLYVVAAALVLSCQMIGCLPHRDRPFMRLSARPTASISSDIFFDRPCKNSATLSRHIGITQGDLNGSVSFANTVVNHLQRLETNLHWSNIHVRLGSPSQGQYIDSRPDLEALIQGKDALIAAKATAYLRDSQCHKYGLNKEACLRYLSTLTMHGTPLHWSCPDVLEQCAKEELDSIYRSVDGSCNNRRNGLWGKSFSGYKRILPAHYLDGVQEIRRSATRRVTLPSPRLVSTSLCGHSNAADNESTLAVMQWGQFIEHDLAHTAVNKMVYSDNTIECCEEDGFNLSPRHKHPFCAPIAVPGNDLFYSDRMVSCIPYVRSIAAMKPDCGYGPIDQMNQASHFLDASQIYGSNIRQTIKLRSFEGGMLKVSRTPGGDFLPASDLPSEHCLYDGICYVSGDSRVNLQPQLAAMHTAWHREHNRIARELSILKPLWDDERLYQEARRIVIAEIQHITYDEWLPILLGQRYLEMIALFGDAYSGDVDPRVSNSFATAALRVFNSLVDDRLDLYTENRRVSKSLNLREHFYKPNTIEQPGHLDDLLRGLTTQASQKLDTDLVDDITNRLYENEHYGFDVLSLDIQRGRDHGLPGYIAFRKLCRLPEARKFSDFADVMTDRKIELLKSVYLVPEDVDLLAGAMSETPVQGSMMGPTLSCIVADQFLRTKFGDRYFYANPYQPKPFAASQLAEIRKVTLARILCDNGDDIQSMQVEAFKKISLSNPLVSCLSEEIRFLNLTLFASEE